MLLVSLVGLNPGSTLFSARVLRPERMALIHTSESAAQAEALAAQASCPSDRVTWDPSLGVDKARERVRKELTFNAERVVIDLTGGTKLMSIGAWQGLADQYGDDLEAVYVDPKRVVLVDAGTGTPRLGGDSRAAIRPEEVLTWYGAQLRITEWQGPLSEIPDGSWTHLELARHLLRAFGEAAVGRGVHRDGGLKVPRNYLPEALPPGTRYKKGRIYSDSKSFLGANVWLEELCLASACRAVGDRADEVFAAHGMVVYAGTGCDDEMDVVLTRGRRIVVIEAKARGSRAGAGADVHKRIQKACRFFGSHVQVIVVIPAWGEEPPRDLRDLTQDHAVLVGADEERLDQEIRRALGLRGARSALKGLSSAKP